MPTFVPGRGPLDAQIVVIGEAPGRNEDRIGRPFVGASGHLMERWMRDAGIDPESCYYDNVYPYFPPGGKIEAVGHEEIAFWTQDLLTKRLAKLRPFVIVPTGNTALRALTGESSITKWRGSILQEPEFEGVKIIPTLHPAAVLHTGGGAEREEQGYKIQIPWEKRCRLDWQRIAEESLTRSYDVPQRRHITDPQMGSEALENMLIRTNHDRCNEILAIDIETPSRKDIACVGFSIDPMWSITIPYDKKWQRRIVKELCESPCEKAMHNGYGFDHYWLRGEGIGVHNFVWDTLAMHHTLDPTEEHSLQFLTSVYTKEPYYKDEGKFEDLDGALRRNFPQLMTYCGRDAAVTRELVDVLYDLLEAQEVNV